MYLLDEQVEKFMILYEKKFGKKLSQKEAYEKGTKLIQLVESVYKSLNKQADNYGQRNNK